MWDYNAVKNCSELAILSVDSKLKIFPKSRIKEKIKANKNRKISNWIWIAK